MALFNNESLNDFPTGNFSLQLLNHIDSKEVYFVCFDREIFFETIVLNSQTSFNDIDVALDSVKQGDHWGLTFLHTNFTQAVKNKFVFSFEFPIDLF